MSPTDSYGAKRNTSLGGWSKYTNKTNHVGLLLVQCYWFNTANIIQQCCAFIPPVSLVSVLFTVPFLCQIQAMSSKSTFKRQSAVFLQRSKLISGGDSDPLSKPSCRVSSTEADSLNYHSSPYVYTHIRQHRTVLILHLCMPCKEQYQRTGSIKNT